MIEAHAKLTQWIKDNPQAAQEHVVDELMHLTQSEEKEREDFRKMVSSSWKRMTLTDTVDIANLEQFVEDGQSTGLLDHVPPVKEMLYSPEPSTAEN